jgi:hypothetical protein
LKILKHLNDARVAHELLNFWIGGSVTDALLVVLSGACIGAGLNGGHGPHLTLLKILIGGVQLKTFIVGFYGLVILLHEVMTGGFAEPGLHEVRIDLQALLGILHRIVELHQLYVGGGAVGVEGLAVGVAPESIIVDIDSAGEVALLEQFVALLAELLGHLRIDQLPLLVLLLKLLGLFELILDVGVVVFEERLLVEVDSLLEETLGKLAVALAADCLAQFHIVIVSTLGELDGLVTSLQALIVVLQLEVYSGLVV